MPWWILVVLLVAWFISAGFSDSSPVMRVIDLASFVLTPVAVIALTTLHFALRSSRRTQIIELVRRASTLTLNPHEAGEFLRAVDVITTHFQPRDVREPPPEISIPVMMHPGMTLRLEYRGTPPHYAAVILSAE